MKPFVFYSDRRLHVRPCPTIISGDDDLELSRSAKILMLRALRVKYPSQLEGLVISEGNGALLLAWQLCDSGSRSPPAGQKTSSSLDKGRFNPLAPSFRPLRQGFEGFGLLDQKDCGSGNDSQLAASASMIEGRSGLHRTPSFVSIKVQKDRCFASTGSMDMPQKAASCPRRHLEEQPHSPSFPCPSYGSLLHVNCNVLLWDEITKRQQELELSRQIVPRPTDHMNNLMQRITYLHQILETRRGDQR